MRRSVELTLSLTLVSASAFGQVPFACTDTAYLFQGLNVTAMYGVSLGSGQTTLLDSSLLDSGPRVINAVGYDVADNYLYGYRLTTNNIVRISADGSNLTIPITGLPSGSFNTGEVDDSRVLYLYDGDVGASSIYRVDLASLMMLSPLATQPTNIADWAYSSFNDRLYAVDTNHVLWSFNPGTGARSNVGAVVSDSMQATGPIGAAYMDLLGNMYISENRTGKIFKIERPDSLGATAVSFFAQGPFSNRNDGAFCRGAIVTSATDISVPKLSLNAYPNPSNGLFTIQFLAEHHQGNFWVYDALGSIVHHSVIPMQSASLNVDLQPYGAGLYLGQLTWNGRKTSIRLLVE